MDSSEIQARKATIVRTHGPWTAHTIHLGDGVYTDADPVRLAGNARLIRRITQIVADLGGAPMNQLRVLDLACLEGQYGIELALQGASVVATDVRDEHLAKTRFAAEELKLERFEVRKADIRDLDAASYGTFDVVLCLGILYHLDAPDVFDVIERLASVCRRLLIIDTHIAPSGGQGLVHHGRSFRGKRVGEHQRWTSQEQRRRNAWASIDNVSSVWLSRASVENALQDAGFTSVYSCDIPAMPGRAPDRLTITALKGAPVSLRCIPAANGGALARADEISLRGRIRVLRRRLAVSMRAFVNAIKLQWRR